MNKTLHAIHNYLTRHCITPATISFWLYCLFGALCFAALIVIAVCQAFDCYETTVSARVAKETAIMVAQVKEAQARIITSHAATVESNRVLSGDISMIEGFGELPIAVFARVEKDFMLKVVWKEGEL